MHHTENPYNRLAAAVQELLEEKTWMRSLFGILQRSAEWLARCFIITFPINMRWSAGCTMWSLHRFCKRGIPGCRRCAAAAFELYRGEQNLLFAHLHLAGSKCLANADPTNRNVLWQQLYSTWQAVHRMITCCFWSVYMRIPFKIRFRSVCWWSGAAQAPGCCIGIYGMPVRLAWPVCCMANASPNRWSWMPFPGRPRTEQLPAVPFPFKKCFQSALCKNQLWQMQKKWIFFCHQWFFKRLVGNCFYC